MINNRYEISTCILLGGGGRIMGAFRLIGDIRALVVALHAANTKEVYEGEIVKDAFGLRSCLYTYRFGARRGVS